MRTLVHQIVVHPGALVEAEWVEVHGDIHKYPAVWVEIRYRGKKIIDRRLPLVRA